jgi:FAD-linked sulfhydryl oxidase
MSVMDNQKYLLPSSQPQTNKMDNFSPPKIKTHDPKVWGPPLWAYLHCSAANYPDQPTSEQINDMIAFLTSLKSTLPCKNCKLHYGQYIDQNRTKLKEICSDKLKLFNFTVDIHNKVNERNNKRLVTYEEAWKMYS